MIRIARANTPAEVGQARTLFQEYAGSLNLDLCFQGFAQELAGLPGAYGPPHGALLLAWWGDEAAGCAGLRRFDSDLGEMKRMYVRPAFRRRGIGRALAQAVVEAARQIGYTRVRLDTVASMVEALTLYRSLGFERIGPYRFNPDPEAVFLEMVLGPQPQPGAGRPE